MMPSRQHGEIPGSFRDPSGVVFLQDGVVYRQVNRTYREEYDHLMASGLYERLVQDGLLIPHTEEGLQHAISQNAYQVIRPEQVPFV